MIQIPSVNTNALLQLPSTQAHQPSIIRCRSAFSKSHIHEEIFPFSNINQNGINKYGKEETNKDRTSKVDNYQENRDIPPENCLEKGFLPVLKNPDFLALWGGQVFSQLADKVYLVLMIALIDKQFQLEGQTISVWVSTMMITFTTPAVVFGSLAGAFVDRWSKKTVLVTTNMWRGALVLAIPLLLWLTQDFRPLGLLPAGFVVILVVTFCVSTLTQFFAPAEQATIPLIIEDHHLLSANSLYTTTIMGSLIVGFAIGEPVLAAADSLWVQIGGSADLGREIIVGVSYIIAAFILLLLKTHEKVEKHTKIESHILSDLQDGLEYLKTNLKVRNALIQLTILFSVFAALTILAVRIAEVIPSLKAEQFGFLLAAGGVGIAIGAAALGQFGQSFAYYRLSFSGCIVMATSLVSLSLTHQLWIILFLVGFLGIGGALIGIPMQTTIQTEVPSEMRGKLFGLQNNVINISLSLPLVFVGIAESIVGLKAVFLALALLVILGGLFTWYNPHR
ncbi:MFS transporter [Richelia intracellularis]|uniref:MFS transporter n=1 Tax=Richelia intracellularis TaxID=1164990 RepID=UPI0003454152|nr:MFS transporter [Richelia intracellularis]